jgi:hypothetical protein
MSDLAIKGIIFVRDSALQLIRGVEFLDPGQAATMIPRVDFISVVGLEGASRPTSLVIVFVGVASVRGEAIVGTNHGNGHTVAHCVIVEGFIQRWIDGICIGDLPGRVIGKRGHTVDQLSNSEIRV